MAIDQRDSWPARSSILATQACASYLDDSDDVDWSNRRRNASLAPVEVVLDPSGHIEVLARTLEVAVDELLGEKRSAIRGKRVALLVVVSALSGLASGPSAAEV